MRSSALSLALAGPIAVYAASGTGKTTRYWDCCKPSCAWEGKAAVSAPVLTCNKNDNPISDANAVSGCDGGTSYTCSNFSPIAVNDNLAYGFAATSIDDGSESSWCCACYALIFTSGSAQGKTMIVQSANTGSDLGSNHFDILMPGGGVGIFDGCTSEFGTALPGEQYGGISSQSQCSTFPEFLKDGCNWRFDWFENADNPSVTFEQVQCPNKLTDISGCKRDDDSSFPVFSSSGASSGSSSGSSAAASSSSAVSEKVETASAKASSTKQAETPAADNRETPTKTRSQAAEQTYTSVQTETPTAEQAQPISHETYTKTRGSGRCSAKRSKLAHKL